jgi:hypothetical protein
MSHRRRSTRFGVQLVIVFVGVLASTPFASDLYVDVNYAGCATGTGTQADPFCSISTAVAAAVAGDTIHIGPGTYVENVIIDKDLTLIGTGGELVTIIDGFQSGSVVTVQAGLVVDIQDLTLTNGSNSSSWASPPSFCGTAGGLQVCPQASVTLTNTTVSGNTAAFGGGGIGVNYAELFMHGSTVVGNSSSWSGGVRASVSSGYGIFVSNSTIEGNAGGGISVDGFSGSSSTPALVMESSTVSANGGTGVYVNIWGKTASLHHSTISGNQGTGVVVGALYTPGVDVVGSTITSNNGVWVGGVDDLGLSYGTASYTSFHSSIVAQNSGGSYPDLSGRFGTLGFNVIGDNSGVRAGPVDGVMGDQVGTPTNPVDPLLAPLADNGGPTQTHALLSGSPAIDAGDPTGTTPDQRGVSRPQGAGVDVGAFELGPSPAFVSIGAGLAGTGGLTPALAGIGTPTPGAAISFDTSNGIGGALGLLAVGLELQPPAPLLGGSLYIVPQWTFGVSLGGTVGTAGAGSSSFPLAIPDDMSLVGVTLAAQAAFVDPGAVQGVSLTGGLRVVIG